MDFIITQRFLENKFKVIHNLKLSSYDALNTLRFHYRDQPANFVSVNKA